jgi:dephospho-CoA kinase
MKKVFLIGGMSESGKSTFGRYLESKGIPRLKIVTFLKKVMVREGATGDFVAWNNKNVLERPEWVREEFTKQFLADILEQEIEHCALESLYGPDLGVYMKSVIGDNKVIIVYVNMEVDVRLQRQMIRQNLTSLDEAKQILLPRDEIKKAWRVPEIETVADVIIDNSGSLDELYRKADEMIRQHCPKYLSK